MNVTLLSAQQREQFTVAHIECKTDAGNLTILPGHDTALYVLALRSPIILYPLEGEGTAFERMVERGMIEIERDKVLVIIG